MMRIASYCPRSRRSRYFQEIVFVLAPDSARLILALSPSPLCLLLFALLAHEFFNSGEFGAHAAQAQHNHTEIGKQASPDDNVGGNKITKALHLFPLSFPM